MTFLAARVESAGRKPKQFMERAATLSAIWLNGLAGLIHAPLRIVDP